MTTVSPVVEPGPSGTALVVRGALAVAVGIAALAWRPLPSETFIAVFGPYLLLEATLASVSARGEAARTTALVLAGLAIVAVGFISLLFPPIAAAVILILLAVWSLADVAWLWPFRSRDTGRVWSVTVAAAAAVLGVGTVVAFSARGLSGAEPELAGTLVAAGILRLLLSRAAPDRCEAHWSGGDLARRRDPMYLPKSLPR